MNSIQKLLIAVVLITLIISCKGTLVEPEPPAGSRDYIWKLDTIDVFGTYIDGLWGSSPSDVWAINSGGTLKETLWHYDGNEWTSDGVFRSVSPSCIFGFSYDDIWIGGSQLEIWHFNGHEWSEEISHYSSDWNFSDFYDIWGDASNNVFAVGYIDSNETRYGLIYHYNGIEWKRKNTDKLESDILSVRKGKSDRNYYMVGSNRNIPWQETSEIYEYDGFNLKKIYRGNNSREENANLVILDGELNFCLGTTFNYFVNGQFIETARFDNLNIFWRPKGRTSNDIFIPQYDGLVHFNGTNLAYIFIDADVIIINVQLFPSDVLFTGYDKENGKSIIAHGTLNKTF